MSMGMPGMGMGMNPLAMAGMMGGSPAMGSMGGMSGMGGLASLFGLGGGALDPAAAAAAAGSSATSDALGEIGAATGKPDYLSQITSELSQQNPARSGMSIAPLVGILGMLSAMQKPQAPNLTPPGFNTPLQPGAPMPGTQGAASGAPPGMSGSSGAPNPYAPRTGAYYTYGAAPSPRFMNPSGPTIPGKTYAGGGAIRAGQPAPFNSAAGDRYVAGGPGGGQDDMVPAQLSPKEYVLDASTMSHLGDGNPDEGARRMDAFRKHVAAHAGAKRVVPPKAKSPLQYFRSAA